MDIAEAERLVEASPDYRLLRRVREPSHWSLAPTQGQTRRAILVDTETTGLDEDDEVIELALLPFEYDRATGAVVSVDFAGALQAFRQPGKPIPAEATRVHGITNEDVAGQTIDPSRIAAIIEPAQLIIAHNAAFDRPMVEKHWQIFADKHWACSLADIDWKSEGVSSAKLDYLLMRQGWFHDGHRALSDANATLFLLSLPLPSSGQLALQALLASARRPLWAVRAEETAFEQRAPLKQRGYRWDDGEGKRRKAWWIATENPQGELDWLREEIYGDERQVPVTKMPPTMRYSARLWAG